MLTRPTPVLPLNAALCFVLIAVAVSTQQKPIKPRASTSNGVTFTFSIAPSLPEFTFKVILGREDEDDPNRELRVKNIEVYRADSPKLLQHLTGCYWAEMQTPWGGFDSDWLVAEDINFDGFRDIYAMTMWGVTGNSSGCVWLYNAKTAKFEYSKVFSDLGGYWLDPATKTIFTFLNGGGGTYTAERYRVEANKPVLIWSETEDFDMDKKEFKCVRQELREGKMTAVFEGKSKPGDQNPPCVPGRLFPSPPPRSRPPN